jgi:predicted dehydrogenase
MIPLRAAVVGAGHLGHFHARKYMGCADVALTAIVDSDPGRALQLAAETGAQACADHRQLLGRVDLASVVVPTSCHYEVTLDLLEAGIHVLVEKPIAATVAQGRHLVELAADRRLTLQVGHLERFNPVMQALAARTNGPMFIESHRIAPFSLRGTDVDVILDLMIHDIDLILNLVDAPVRGIDASGSPVLSSQLDIANARLQFTTGCVANVTASRVSHKRERRMRLFQHDAYLSADMIDHKLNIYRKMEGEMFPGTAGVQGIPSIQEERLEFAPGDALGTEIQAFVSSVRNGTPPVVSGADGLRALQVASEIIRQLEASPLPGQQAGCPLAPGRQS